MEKIFTAILVWIIVIYISKMQKKIFDIFHHKEVTILEHRHYVIFNVSQHILLCKEHVTCKNIFMY